MTFVTPSLCAVGACSCLPRSDSFGSLIMFYVWFRYFDKKYTPPRLYFKSPHVPFTTLMALRLTTFSPFCNHAVPYLNEGSEKIKRPENKSLEQEVTQPAFFRISEGRQMAQSHPRDSFISQTSSV